VAEDGVKGRPMARARNPALVNGVRRRRPNRVFSENGEN
jgi:hypothetical protein